MSGNELNNEDIKRILLEVLPEHHMCSKHSDKTNYDTSMMLGIEPKNYDVSDPEHKRHNYHTHSIRQIMLFSVKYLQLTLILRDQ